MTTAPDPADPRSPSSPGSAIGARVDVDREPRPEPGPSRPPEPGPSAGSPASPWRRLGAYLVDSLLLAVPTNLLFQLVLGRTMPADVDFTAPAETIEVLWPFSALAFGLEILYFAGMEASGWQATIGKHLLDAQVTDDAGGRLSFPRALARNAGKLLSALPFGLGFLLVFVTDRNQALHDKLASCLVLDDPEDEPEPPGPTEDPRGGSWP